MSTSVPLANLITLGARDLPALRNFYRALGWPQIMDDGAFAAFEIAWADMPNNPVVIATRRAAGA